jgi:hypothetical protein
MAFQLPESIDSGTPIVAAEHQLNYTAIRDHMNTNLVNKDGSVAMTGALLLPANPTSNMQAAPKQYVDQQRDTRLALTGGTLSGALTVQSTLTTTGAVTLPASDPTNANHAARKAYVDSGDANQLSLTGGTVSGATTFSSNVRIDGAIRTDGVLAFQTTGGATTGTLRGVTPYTDTSSTQRDLNTTRQALNLTVSFTPNRSGWVMLYGVFDVETLAASGAAVVIECSYQLGTGTVNYFTNAAIFKGAASLNGVTRSTVAQNWYLAVTAGTTYNFACWAKSTANSNEYRVNNTHSTLHAIVFT